MAVQVTPAEFFINNKKKLEAAEVPKIPTEVPRYVPKPEYRPLVYPTYPAIDRNLLILGLILAAIVASVAIAAMVISKR